MAIPCPGACSPSLESGPDQPTTLRGCWGWQSTQVADVTLKGCGKQGRGGLRRSLSLVIRRDLRAAYSVKHLLFQHDISRTMCAVSRCHYICANGISRSVVAWSGTQLVSDAKAALSTHRKFAVKPLFWPLVPITPGPLSRLVSVVNTKVPANNACQMIGFTGVLVFIDKKKLYRQSL
jgi:hypothetical protein